MSLGILQTKEAEKAWEFLAIHRDLSVHFYRVLHREGQFQELFTGSLGDSTYTDWYIKEHFSHWRVNLPEHAMSGTGPTPDDALLEVYIQFQTRDLYVLE